LPSSGAPITLLLQTDGLIAARILLALAFLYSGQDKLRHWRSSVREVAGLGLPWPGLFTVGTIAVQFAGGASLAVGLGARWGAALLAAFTVAATLLGHRFWLLHGVSERRELTTTLEHLGIVGGLLLIVIAPT
jgi:putative oxidoreductase